MPSAAAKKSAKAPVQKVAHARIAEPVLVKGRREFFKYRGECHHSTEAANVLQRLVELFRSEFEARIPAPAVPVVVEVPESALV